MEDMLIYPDNEEQLEAVKAVLNTLKIKFGLQNADLALLVKNA